MTDCPGSAASGFNGAVLESSSNVGLAGTEPTENVRTPGGRVVQRSHLLIDFQIVKRDRSRVPARVTAGSRIFEFKYHVVIRIQSNQQCFGEIVSYRIVH